MRICPECEGDKVVKEPCQTCKGMGFLRKKRPFRKGVRLLSCTNAKCSWGAITKVCPTCKGLGQIP